MLLFRGALRSEDASRMAKAARMWRDQVLFGPETNMPCPPPPVLPTIPRPSTDSGLFAQIAHWHRSDHGLARLHREHRRRARHTWRGDNSEARGRCFALLSRQPRSRIIRSRYRAECRALTRCGVEYARKGEGWKPVAFLTNTPAYFTIRPPRPANPRWEGSARYL